MFQMNTEHYEVKKRLLDLFNDVYYALFIVLGSCITAYNGWTSYPYKFHAFVTVENHGIGNRAMNLQLRYKQTNSSKLREKDSKYNGFSSRICI